MKKINKTGVFVSGSPTSVLQRGVEKVVRLLFLGERVPFRSYGASFKEILHGEEIPQRESEELARYKVEPPQGTSLGNFYPPFCLQFFLRELNKTEDEEIKKT